MPRAAAASSGRTAIGIKVRRSKAGVFADAEFILFVPVRAFRLVLCALHLSTGLQPTHPTGLESAQESVHGVRIRVHYQATHIVRVLRGAQKCRAALGGTLKPSLCSSRPAMSFFSLPCRLPSFFIDGQTMPRLLIISYLNKWPTSGAGDILKVKRGVNGLHFVFGFFLQVALLLQKSIAGLELFNKAW